MKKIGPKTRKYMVTVGMAIGLLLSCMVSGAFGYRLISQYRDLATKEWKTFQPWSVKDLYRGRIKVMTQYTSYANAATRNAVAQLNSIPGTGIRFTVISNEAQWIADHPDVYNKTSWWAYGNVALLPGIYLGIGHFSANAAVAFGGASSGSIKNTPGSASIFINEWDNDLYWGIKTPPKDKIDGWGVIAHELGHVAGLDHVPERQCTNPATSPLMCADQLWGATNNRTTEPDDIRGLKALYPSGARKVPTAH